MGKKGTTTEVRQRIDEVLRIMLDGAQFHDVFQYASEKGWNVSPRMVRYYMRAASKLLERRLDRKRDRVIALHLARRESLYARCVNAADYRTALSVLADEAKLIGLYPAPTPPAPTEPTKVVVEIKETVVDSRTDSRTDSDTASDSGGRGSSPEPDAVGVPPQ